jgi:hypothetical protein
VDRALPPHLLTNHPNNGETIFIMSVHVNERGYSSGCAGHLLWCLLCLVHPTKRKEHVAYFKSFAATKWQISSTYHICRCSVFTSQNGAQIFCFIFVFSIFYISRFPHTECIHPSQSTILSSHPPKTIHLRSRLNLHPCCFSSISFSFSKKECSFLPSS